MIAMNASDHSHFPSAAGAARHCGCLLRLGLVFAVALPLGAHEIAVTPPAPEAVPMPNIVETSGPARLSRSTDPAPVRRTGQGYWTFTAEREGILPIPAAAQPHVRGAHGTLIVDAERDTVFWGLENVGWVAFSNRLAQSWIVEGDPAFRTGNLHGADLLERRERRGERPLVAVADNVENEVYLSDTSFSSARRLDWPEGAPYAAKSEYHPTDVAFTRSGELFVTDGYGRAHFMGVDLESLTYRDPFYGGKEVSQTPHGITLAQDGSLLLAARPEGQVKRWSIEKEAWLEVLGLPAGSTVCDVELWGDYALAPCLDGPDKSPGPIYVVNLKKRMIVSVLRPKVDLGFDEAQHIHDATWYFPAGPGKEPVYVLFTNWNPGGIGALKLVGPTR